MLVPAELQVTQIYSNLLCVCLCVGCCSFEVLNPPPSKLQCCHNEVLLCDSKADHYKDERVYMCSGRLRSKVKLDIHAKSIKPAKVSGCVLVCVLVHGEKVIPTILRLVCVCNYAYKCSLVSILYFCFVYLRIPRMAQTLSCLSFPHTYIHAHTGL